MLTYDVHKLLVTTENTTVKDVIQDFSRVFENWFKTLLLKLLLRFLRKIKTENVDYESGNKEIFPFEFKQAKFTNMIVGN